MKNMVSLIVICAVTSAIFFLLSCENQSLPTFDSSQSSTTFQTEGTTSIQEYDPTPWLSLDDSLLIKNMSEQEVADSIFKDLIQRMPDEDPEILRHSANTNAKALKGEPIYLSLYEVEELPGVPAPGTSHTTMRTELGTFYFVMPSCICGYIVLEDRYFDDPCYHSPNHNIWLTCSCMEE